MSYDNDEIVTFTDYSRDNRGICYACRHSVLVSQPCYIALIGKNRERVLHEGCADQEIEPGKTHFQALKDAARAYVEKRK